MLHQHWGSIASEAVYPGITRQTVQGELQTVVRYIYQPGAVFPRHAQPQEQITLVLSGTIAFTIGDAIVELGAGDVAVIPANVPHGARVTGTEIVESFNTLSPARTVQPG
ncbi:MAG TPA: cupin domain-containing protein [Thermomicrobiales bacterium]|nr:cupin domain-containing protein [Thermomicrobiales bacterium]